MLTTFSMTQKKLISLIIPAYNEAENLPLICEQLKAVFVTSLPAFDYEILIINDGSTDYSHATLESLAAQNPCVKYLEFTRNFGKELATSAGLHFAKGDAAIMLDADLQHPTTLIPDFVRKWEEGADMVIGVRTRTKGNKFFRKLSSMLFYKILNRVGEIQVVPNATDYRLVDRSIIDEFNRFTERNRITRGLLDWLGFNKEYIHFEADERKHGKPVYSKLKLFKLAMTTFVSHSLFPLKAAGYLGVLITVCSGTLGLAILIGRYIFHNAYFSSFTGPAQLAIFLTFLVGIILMALGLIALYIGNIHTEVVNRPMYIVKRKHL